LIIFSLKKVAGDQDKAILHSLLDKLKKDTLDVKVRRRSQQQRTRQRSTSVSMMQQSYSTQNIDVISLQAKRLLRSIQGEPSSSLLDSPGSPSKFEFGHSASTTTHHHHHHHHHRLPDMRRRMSASVAIPPSFKTFFEQEAVVESPLNTSTLGLPPSIPEEQLGSSRRRQRPLSASIVFPQESLSSSTSTTPKQVRIRKTSKRPIFDHTLRTRARRMSTR
jgi:hypothetical protein